MCLDLHATCTSVHIRFELYVFVKQSYICVKESLILCMYLCYVPVNLWHCKSSICDVTNDYHLTLPQIFADSSG